MPVEGWKTTTQRCKRHRWRWKQEKDWIRIMPTSSRRRNHLKNKKNDSRCSQTMLTTIILMGFLTLIYQFVAKKHINKHMNDKTNLLKIDNDSICLAEISANDTKISRNNSTLFSPIFFSSSSVEELVWDISQIKSLSCGTFKCAFLSKKYTDNYGYIVSRSINKLVIESSYELSKKLTK